MKAKIYSHHLYEVSTSNNEQVMYLFDFVAKPRGIKFIFHSENCFSVQNEHGEYLTAFNDGKIKFYAKKCQSWEKFYILDIACQNFINQSITHEFKDKRNKIIKDFKLFIQDDKLFVMLGATIITPSYFPAVSITINHANSIKYKTYHQCTILNKKRKIIYFCVYGKDEYYELFLLSIKSLIELGKYDGDILIKTDDIKKCQELVSNFNNNFYYTLIDEKLGIFNRYNLHENILTNYDSIIYLDCDILTINHVNHLLNRLCESADFLAYIESDNQNYKKEFSDKYKWWGINYLTYNQHIDNKNYFLYNSGFFVINNLQNAKFLFNRVIDYRQFETATGDQPFLNLALYNCEMDIKGIDKNDGLAFSRNLKSSFDNMDKTFIHFNSGVGNLSKLNLMKSFYEQINN